MHISREDRRLNDMKSEEMRVQVICEEESVTEWFQVIMKKCGRFCSEESLKGRMMNGVTCTEASPDSLCYPREPLAVLFSTLNKGFQMCLLTSPPTVLVNHDLLA